MVVFNNLNSVLWKHHLVLLVTWDFSKFGCLIFKSATAQDFRLHGSELFPPAKKERHLLLADVSLWFRRPSVNGFACGENARRAQSHTQRPCRRLALTL